MSEHEFWGKIYIFRILKFYYIPFSTQNDKDLYYVSRLLIRANMFHSLVSDLPI